jgi:hypothetical protein
LAVKKLPDVAAVLIEDGVTLLPGKALLYLIGEAKI